MSFLLANHTLYDTKGLEEVGGPEKLCRMSGVSSLSP